MIFIGVIGGLIFRVGLVSTLKPSTLIIMGFLGVLLTLLYDLLTNLAVAYTVGQLIPVMLAAIPFTLIHTGSNAVIFVVLTPLLFKLAKLEKKVWRFA